MCSATKDKDQRIFVFNLQHFPTESREMSRRFVHVYKASYEKEVVDLFVVHENEHGIMGIWRNSIEKEIEQKNKWWGGKDDVWRDRWWNWKKKIE